jgi:hypothetical protein
VKKPKTPYYIFKALCEDVIAIATGVSTGMGDRKMRFWKLITFILMSILALLGGLQLILCPIYPDIYEVPDLILLKIMLVIFGLMLFILAIGLASFAISDWRDS